ASEQALDMQAPAPAEAALLQAPLAALRARLAALLVDWPGHPVLSQLDAIVERLLALPATTPLKAALTGLELLLLRAQLWQDTAARHVSLEAQLAPAAALAARWRRLELASWRALLRRTAERAAAGAHRSWFHLYRVLMQAETPPGDNPAPGALVGSSDPVAVEQFVQTAPLGELERRLELLASFRGHCLARAAAGDGGGAVTAAVLGNALGYYGQFRVRVAEAAAGGLVPLEKQLQDFVKLARWEDRGYYALRERADKAQRQLHKLQRRAAAVLAQPCASVLAAASAAMGLNDLAAPELPAPEASAAAHTLPKKRRKAAATAEPNWAAQAEDDRQCWQELRAVTTQAAAASQPLAASLPPEVSAALRLGEPDARLNRLPQLARRLAAVLEAAGVGPPAFDPASLPGAGAEALAGEAAQRALELRGLTERGARARKKKALTDFLRALEAAGASRRRSAVPAAERSVQAWFEQAPPDDGVHVLLEGPAEGAPEGAAATRGVSQLVLAHAAGLWAKADAYYFRTIARLQRLWQACKAPHADIAAGEAEAAVRLCEHLLHLQRRQRAWLGRTGVRLARVRALSAALAAFGQPSSHAQIPIAAVTGAGTDDPAEAAALAAALSVPPQAAARRWIAEQAVLLAALGGRLRDTLCLLGAAADAEPALAPQRLMLDAAGALQRIRTEGARIVTPLALRALAESCQVLLQQQAALDAASVSQGFAADAPGWADAAASLAFAAGASPGGGSGARSGGAARQELDVSGAALWAEGAEAAVEALLLWAQALPQAPAGTQDREDGTGDGVTVGQQLALLEARGGGARLDAVCAASERMLALLADAGSSGGALARVQAAQAASLAPLLALTAAALQRTGVAALALAKSSAKLGYVAAALLAGVVSEGFCTAAEEAAGGADAGTGAFQEAGGTGMGEGEGAKDVSDQITDEDQLLGARQKDQPPPDQQEEPPAGDDNAKGIEMEGDFDGSLHDIPPNPEGESGSEPEDEGEAERLEQEMGDVGAGGDVVDERLWGQDDKPEAGQAPGEEKYERDAPVQVDGSRELEYRAGEEEPQAPRREPKQADLGKHGAPEPQPSKAGGADDGEEEGEQEGAGEGRVNEADQEQYEDRTFAAPQAPEPDLDLPEDMDLDADEAGSDGAANDTAGGDEDESGDADGNAHDADAPPQRFPEQPVRAEGEPGEDGGGDQGQDPEDMDEGLEGDEGDEAVGEGKAEDGTAGEDGAAAELEAPAGDEGVDEGGVGGDAGMPDAAGADEAGEELTPAAAHGGEAAGAQEQLPEGGPQGAAAASAAHAQAVRGAGGGRPDEQEPREERGDCDKGTEDMAEAAGEAAPQDAPRSRAGAGEAGPAGAAAPGQGGEEQLPQRLPRGLQEANPYRSLGDAMERWRARLAVAGDPGAQADAADQGAGADEGEEGEEGAGGAEDAARAGGEYEFVAEGKRRGQGDTQALAPATEEQAAAAAAPDAAAAADGDEDMPDADSDPISDPETALEAADEAADKAEHRPAGVQRQRTGGSRRAALAEGGEEKLECESGAAEGLEEGLEEGVERQGVEGSFAAALAQHAAWPGLDPGASDALGSTGLSEEAAAALRESMASALSAAAAEDALGGGSAADEQYGREMWARCEALTSGLAGELAEQLRAILEPTRARRLAGDYRTGKRLAMRKVIAYIASHFRKDKIWLRRTRPDQRTYQVVLAVDDSRSMREGGCGTFALEAVTLLARALARLEVGELGVLRFGGAGAVAPLHALGRPFADADGPRVLSQMRFAQDNTIADRPMVELLAALRVMLDEARARAGSSGPGGGALQQLVLILADGRFHEKEALRRAVQEASEQRGVLLAFIILDNPAASLLDTQAVSFAGGAPTFAPYLDSFPFPFYIVLRDIAALPATLAALLRQWFELSAAGG
ncbi:hypothetical protein WJX81_006213, partial [Elliptochloris bilobata]